MWGENGHVLIVDLDKGLSLLAQSQLNINKEKLREENVAVASSTESKRCNCFKSKLLIAPINSDTEVEPRLLRAAIAFHEYIRHVHTPTPAQRRTCIFGLQVEEPSETQPLHLPRRQNVVPARGRHSSDSSHFLSTPHSTVPSVSPVPVHLHVQPAGPLQQTLLGRSGDRKSSEDWWKWFILVINWQ